MYQSRKASWSRRHSKQIPLLYTNDGGRERLEKNMQERYNFSKGPQATEIMDYRRGREPKSEG